MNTRGRNAPRPAACTFRNRCGPKSAIAWSELRPVSDLHMGERGRLTRLLEDVELNHDVLKFLEEHKLMPGHDLTLVEIGPDGTRTLDVEGDKVGLDAKLAGNLWVLPA